MLHSVNLDDKTYEELRQKAVSKIPLYSSEWTNFNKSDPGITILEALTSFQLMQQKAINTVTPAVQMKLLKMAGYVPEPAGCARVLLGVSCQEQKINLPMNQKLYAGETCLETPEEIIYDRERILGVYIGSRNSGQMSAGTDITELVKTELPIGCEIFTEQPESGRFMDILLSGTGIKEQLIFYISAEERVKRNPFSDNKRIPFARVVWQVWTPEGFWEIPVEKVRDETCGFLVSGEIRIQIPANAAVSRLYPKEGYLLRALLAEADYDIPPKVRSIEGFLFEVFQKDSLGITYTIDGNCRKASAAPVSEERYMTFELYGVLQDSGYQSVYCMEQEDGIRKYYKYNEIDMETGDDFMEQGRFYRKIPAGDSRYYYCFNKHGRYHPAACKKSLRIVCYGEQAFSRRLVGDIYGYDNQLFELSVKNIFDGDLLLLVEYENRRGEIVYDFVPPGLTGDEELNFIPVGDSDKILVTNPGIYAGGRLYFANVSVFAGAEGNVRKGNEFFISDRTDVVFFNPAKGRGGRKKETVEELKKRFAADMLYPDCAVNREDYGRIIMNTPGLAIHKVRAVMDKGGSSVSVAVKPYSIAAMPKLSEVYKEEIMKYIEDKRLLTTKVKLCSPVYVPINVHCVLYVKKYAESCRKMAQELIRKQLDYTVDDHDFGEKIIYGNLFRAIESLEGVEYVYSLSVKAGKSRNVTMAGCDIIPDEDSLCYPGDIVVDTKTM